MLLPDSLLILPCCSCNEVAWWHNGNLQTVYNSLSGDDAANMNITKELDDRENHYLMELRGGDVLSFRYKASSYYCQIHKMELTVNGTVVTDLFSNPLINITYAREHSTGWFLPLFSPNYGEGESEADLALFLPPRPSMFNGSAIAPDANVDWWSPPVQSDPDLKTSNWYWRIVLDPSCTFFFDAAMTFLVSFCCQRQTLASCLCRSHIPCIISKLLLSFTCSNSWHSSFLFISSSVYLQLPQLQRHRRLSNLRFNCQFGFYVV